MNGRRGSGEGSKGRGERWGKELEKEEEKEEEKEDKVVKEKRRR